MRMASIHGLFRSAGLCDTDLAHTVQQSVERYVQDTVGIPVTDVLVEVKSVSGESKARVE